MSSNLYDKTTQTLIPYAGSNEATTASLESLSNVLITSPTNGQVLAFDAESLKWKNTDKQIPDIEMNEIYDVSIVSVSNGQILKWNQFTSKWENSTFNDITSLGAIPNVHLDQLENGQFLVYDTTSGMWLNTTLEYQAPLVADYGISINPSNNKIKTKTFVGTIDEWYGLSLSEQMSYDFVNIKGDEQTESYDIQIAYVDELPSEGTIQDIVYGLQNYGSVVTTTAADGFLDSASGFTKTTVTGGYKYTSDTAVISLDNYSFYPFDDITYDGTKFVISWGHGWTDTDDLALGDTLYYKVTTGIQFYGGHSATQSYKNFANPVDVVEDGNMSAVTSNAVFDVINNEVSTRSFLGAKNLFPNNGTTQTVNGITMTVNADKSVTFNGTATTDFGFEYGANTLDSGNYILSKGSSDNNPNLYLYNYATSSVIATTDSVTEHDNVPFTLNAQTTFTPATWITSGQTFSNAVIKPMIRLATDSDSTYQPYSMTNKEITPYVQSISNPNLLDNPWFTVNQREFTSGSSTGYTADRWRASISSGASGTFTLSNGVMTIASDSGNVYLVQKVTNDNLTALIGKMLVVSIMLSDSSIISGSGLYDGNTLSLINNENIFVYTTSSTSSNPAIVNIQVYSGKSISIKAVKLELGSRSTLANDVAPNYAEELAKCQRYFVRYRQSNTDTIAQGVARDTTKLRFLMPLPVPMRTPPSVTPSSTVGDYTNTGLTITRTGTNVTYGDGSVGLIQLNAVSSTSVYTAGEAKNIAVTSDNFYIDFSADL